MAQGVNVSQISVEVFTMNGKRVLVRRESGNVLRLDLSQYKHVLANGVYVYRVNVMDKSGKTRASRIIKVALMR